MRIYFFPVCELVIPHSTRKNTKEIDRRMTYQSYCICSKVGTLSKAGNEVWNSRHRERLPPASALRSHFSACRFRQNKR